MPRPDPTPPYSVPGFRVALVREPGVKLAERPSLKTPAEAARVLAEYIGERDREVFVVALLTIRHRLIGVHTVSVGCLTSSLVHPPMVMKPAILASAACGPGSQPSVGVSGARTAGSRSQDGRLHHHG